MKLPECSITHFKTTHFKIPKRAQTPRLGQEKGGRGYVSPTESASIASESVAERTTDGESSDSFTFEESDSAREIALIEKTFQRATSAPQNLTIESSQDTDVVTLWSPPKIQVMPVTRT